MKKYIALLFMVIGIANSQTLANDSSYATTDTTAWVSIGNGNQVLVIYAKDSINVTIDMDFAESKTATSVFQTYRVADSTNSVVAAGFFKGYLLRAGATNNIAGAGAVRLRMTRLTGSGKNGTTTPTYDAYIRQY